MADSTVPAEHVFKLSTIDQAVTREYLRFALCFPTNGATIEAIKNNLNATLKRTITQIPILAGIVRRAKDGEEVQESRLEVVVHLTDVANFKATSKHIDFDEFEYSYEALARSGMPPSVLVCDVLTPLQDEPHPYAGPVFAIQANFIDGGLILALYLHHSVSDIVGMRTIISSLTSSLPTRKIGDEDLEDDVVEDAGLRARLSDAKGARADSLMVATSWYGGNAAEQTTEELMRELTVSGTESTCRVVFFNLKKIEDITALINTQIHDIRRDYSVQVNRFDIIAAILWKGITRARIQAVGNDHNLPEETSTVLLPMNIRSQLQPPLEQLYFGNAYLPGLATESVSTLNRPFEAVALTQIARMIRNAVSGIGEGRVRSIIAGINESADVQLAPLEKLNGEKDLLIQSWANLKLEGADMGLGIRHPAWGRKVGRKCMASGCIVHPVRSEEGWWEVTVELASPVMGALLSDEGFTKFVSHVA